jgi:hypothetical protein
MGFIGQRCWHQSPCMLVPAKHATIT